MFKPASHRLVSAAAKSRSAQSFSASYATVKGFRHEPERPEDIDVSSDNDFIVSILRANPSARDAKSYLASFGTRPRPVPVRAPSPPPLLSDHQVVRDDLPAVQEPKPSPIVTSILDPVHHKTALVKLQGPFTDRQLDSIARGVVYLQKLGLVSVIIVEQDRVPRGEQGEREVILEETTRVVEALEKQGAKTRPVLGAVVRLGPYPSQDPITSRSRVPMPEAHTFPSDLAPIRSALRAGEIPVLSPLALDSFCRSARVDANDVIAALARGMVEAAELDRGQKPEEITRPEIDVDLTPMRLMIISREGGVPSYARFGLPHLLVNLEAEYQYIHETFQSSWKATHPTALSNLALAHTCLAYMPPSSSAIMVNHRAPSSMIGNLITNKPAVSSSLPHALLQGNQSLTSNTPTLLRRGLSVEVIRDCSNIDKAKMTLLLEQSFGRALDSDAFYARLERDLDFVIVAGDYAGAAIVTRQTSSTHSSAPPVVYLDKFAVLPSHQGDGTVDFLWVALHDETYGLGLPFSVNANGGKEGRGEGGDLVWRSRSNNPVNKWYFERSSGHVRMGDWVLFWCDAEKRLKTEEGRRASAGLSFVEEWEHGRLAVWADVVPKVPSSWKK